MAALPFQTRCDVPSRLPRPVSLQTHVFAVFTAIDVVSLVFSVLATNLCAAAASPFYLCAAAALPFYLCAAAASPFSIDRHSETRFLQALDRRPDKLFQRRVPDWHIHLHSRRQFLQLAVRYARSEQPRIARCAAADTARCAAADRRNCTSTA